MNQYFQFANKLKDVLTNSAVLLDEPMKEHTSFKVGGPVDVMVIPKDYEDLQKVIKISIEDKVPYYIMGNGSNILVKDKGIRGLVIKLTDLNAITIDGNRLTAQGGALVSEVSEKALEASLTGFEFACGIPGCVGGAVAMNAGAYVSDISNVIEKALVIDDNGSILNLTKEELDLSYRNSIILKNGYTVLEATFLLQSANYDEIKSLIEDLQSRRKDKQPLEYPSAGSTFKRPEGYYAGKLIEDSGLKGAKVGGAEVSQKHSGFIINKDNATATDVFNLIKLVQKTVYEKFGVELHTEVRIIGED